MTIENLLKQMKILLEEYNEHYSDNFDLLTIRFKRSKIIKLMGFSDITKQFIGNQDNWYFFPSNKKCEMSFNLWLNSLQDRVKKSEIDLKATIEI